jgi:hypothetical protein
MKNAVRVSPARNSVHKFMAVFPDGAKVYFGRKGYSDYTKHGDSERMKRYLVRHRSRENWSRGGSKTAGFWSRWLLWSKPSLGAARRQTEKILGKKIVLVK